MISIYTNKMRFRPEHGFQFSCQVKRGRRFETMTRKDGEPAIFHDERAAIDWMDANRPDGVKSRVVPQRRA